MAIHPLTDPRYRWLHMEAARLELERQAHEAAMAEPDHEYPVGWDERDALI